MNNHKNIKKRERDTYRNEKPQRGYSDLWDERAMEKLLKFGGKHQWDHLRSKHIEGSDVLDLAVGGGLHSVELATEFQAKSVTAIDIESSRLTHTHPSVEHLTADGEQLPFADNSFEVVTIKSAFHHFPRWKTNGIDEICRVLNSDGVFLFFEPGYWNPPAWFRRRFLRSSIHTPDEHPFKPDELESVLRSKFYDVEIDGFHFISNLLPVAANYIPLDIPDKIYQTAVQVETKMPLRKFSWLLIGAAKNIRSV